MLIKDIIAEKTLDKILTVKPDDNVLDMARILCRHQIASVLVMGDNDEVVGIATERDLTRAILEYREDTIALPINKIMNYPVISCSPDDHVMDTLEIMTAKRIRHMPVMAGDKALAMLSIREFDFACRQLESAANTDDLTGLPNRRGFMKHLEAEINRFQRYKDPFSIAIMDIDHFKKINDTYGHDVGDKVLRVVSKVVVDALRNYDTVGRIGGEEFGIIFPKTEVEHALLGCERAAEAIRNIVVKTDAGNIEVTASFGLTGASGDISEAGVILKQADIMLYQAKETGRDRIEVSNSEERACA